MYKPAALMLLSLYMLTLSSSALGQVPAETKSVGTKTAEKPLPAKREDAIKKAEAERAARERRTQARSLLISLAADARTFRDQTLRSRSLARIADALWQVDAEQARLLFRKAWEAADVADQESQQKLREEIRQQKAKTGGAVAVKLVPPDLRREVLKLAARHDRVLGEEFLEKLKAQKQEVANAAADATRHSTGLDESLSQRLEVARELLLVGDVEGALQFADAALGAVTIETVSFLANLRGKKPALADQRYAAMLASANTDLRADANTISLLSSYIFTPDRFLTFNSGDVSSAYYGAAVETPAAVAPELRNAFFQAAAGILLRPQPPADQDQSTSGIEGKYLVIKHLLPFFEQFATRDIAEAVRGQLNALNSLISDSVRRQDNEWVRRGVEPEKEAVDEQSILGRTDRVRTSAERDELYMQLAHGRMGRADIRARDFVSKIEDTELRKQAQAFIDAGLAQHSVEKKLTDQALELARKGELTHIQRVWVLTECATQLAKTDREKALELVDEAVLEARRIDGSDPYWPRGLFAVANVLKSIDPARVWDAAFDAVKAANSAEGFTGEDGELALRYQNKGWSVVYGNDVPEFNLEGIFRELATRDYDRAVELARGFQGEGPRAVATIAIARAVLEPKTTGTARAKN
jgi:hypothetical protein